MIGYVLTVTQKNKLIGNWFKPSSYFNPIQDALDRWILTERQVDECVNPDFDWVKNLNKTTFVKKPFTLPI